MKRREFENNKERQPLPQLLVHPYCKAVQENMKVYERMANAEL